MEFLKNKTPKENLVNIHALVLSVMLNNKEEIVKVNGYGAISANNESANNVYIV